ncbi:hypothetical protein [Armatimonas sp.]|uniref:hypothetical protein n=1 Tax=Armatimonas sp. TaxID=1872638 RepID=UPI00286C9AB6|nr:hypothetical protein [Armatimonas sp.]
MKRISMALIALIAGMLAPLPVQAQAEGGTTQRAARTRPLESVLQALTRSTGITVVAESSLLGAEAVYSQSATAETLEKQLDIVVKSLPPGTVWKKAMLPASTRFYKGDDVADFLDIQARMLGRAKPGEAGSVEILGQKLTQEKAAPVVSTLGLKPVYVLVNANSRQASRDPLTGASSQSDFSQILGNFSTMNPEARTKLMQQFGQMMQNMSPEQRRQMFSGMMGSSGGVFVSPGRPIPPQ